MVRPLQNRIRVGLGCFTLLVIVLVFSVEATLALLRQRTLDVTLEIRSAVQTATLQAVTDVTATPTVPPGATPVAKTITITVDPSATLIVHVKWDYRIGPRFPDTRVHADVTDHNNQIVASAENTILCGSDSIQCRGDFLLTLSYGSKGDSAISSAWLPGDYLLLVTSGIADLKPTEKLRQPFTVQAAP